MTEHTSAEVEQFVADYAKSLEPPDRQAFVTRLSGRLRETLLRVEDPVLIECARGAIAKRTGRIPTDDQAAYAAAAILDRNGIETVRRPANYLIAAIERDKNPARFLPAEPGGQDLRAWLLSSNGAA
jgi:hypothetical protein